VANDVKDGSTTDFCVEEGCTKPIKNKEHGWCSMHYERFRRHGDPSITYILRGRICQEEGCGKKHFAKGWCGMHYRRLLKHGDPSIKRKLKYGEICVIDNCDRSSFSYGHCSAHYKQVYVRGNQPSAIRGIARMGSMQANDGVKRCGTCRELHSIEMFPKSKRAADGFAPNCKSCNTELLLIRRFGISGAEKQEIWEAQGFRCAASGLVQNDTQQIWVIDHCHTSESIRGVLHPKINAVLGLLEDDPERTTQVMRFINRFSDERARPFYGTSVSVNRKPAGYWAGRTDEGDRNSHLVRTYKISLDEWNELFRSQDNRCAICRSPETQGWWHTDHAHRLDKDGSNQPCTRRDVRAILCNNCNTAVGFVESLDPANDGTALRILQNAVDYLQWHSMTDTTRKRLVFKDRRSSSLELELEIVVYPHLSQTLGHSIDSLLH
jgi:hypothetical protein